MQGQWPYTVNFDHFIPVYEQIENHVRFAVASGALKPGDKLPSIRDLAETLEVNANTVTKAYRDLELMGILTTRRGVGVQITPNAHKVCGDHTRELVLNRLRDAAAECNAAGIPAKSVRQTLQEALNDGRMPYGGP